MKQRKKQPEVTRQAILAAAGTEFARHGYAGSGLGAIVAGAGLTKGALFHHFADKRSLAKAWLEEDLARSITVLWMEPLAGMDSLADLKRVCRANLGAIQAGDATATLAALAGELGGQDEVLAACLEGIFSDWRGAVAALLERGRLAGGVFRSVKPAAEATMLVALATGLAVQAGVARDAALRQLGLASIEDYLDTLRAQ